MQSVGIAQCTTTTNAIAIARFTQECAIGPRSTDNEMSRRCGPLGLCGLILPHRHCSTPTTAGVSSWLEGSQIVDSRRGTR